MQNKWMQSDNVLAHFDYKGANHWIFFIGDKFIHKTFQTLLVYRATLAEQVSEEKYTCCPAPFQVTVHHDCLPAAS